MASLLTRIPSPLRPLYPGELRISLGASSSDRWQTSVPDGMFIAVQHFDPAKKLDNPALQGDWELSAREGEPVLLALWPGGHAPQDALAEQMPGLESFAGRECARECAAILGDLLRNYVHAGSEDKPYPNSQWASFTDLAGYNDLIIGLAQYTSSPGTTGRQVLSSLLIAWDRDYPAQMDWYAANGYSGHAEDLAALMNAHRAVTGDQLRRLAS